MLRVQQRSPGSPLAERALLRTADWYYSSADYDLAHDAYGVYVKNYPRSPMVPQVKLRQAFSSLAQFRGVRFGQLLYGGDDLSGEWDARDWTRHTIREKLFWLAADACLML